MLTFASTVPLFVRPRACPRSCVLRASVEEPADRAGRAKKEREADSLRRYRVAARQRLALAVENRDSAEIKLQVAELEAVKGSFGIRDGAVESLGGAVLDGGFAGARVGVGEGEFEEGVRLFMKGRYGNAVKIFEEVEGRAVEGGREAGQIGLWRAQGIYAMGGEKGRKEALMLLDRLEKECEDADVRKAAVEMRYIFAAPKLDDAIETITMPEFGEEEGQAYFVLAANGVGQAARRKKQEVEKYSLEWYAQMAEPAPPADDEAECLLPAVLAAATLAFGLSALYR